MKTSIYSIKNHITPKHLSFLIFILSIISFLPFYDKGITIHDEGYILYVSELVSRGKLLYKDIFVQYPPGLFLLFAFLFKVFGVHILIGRLLIVLVGAIINVSLFKISYRIAPSKYALIPSILFMIWGIPQTNIPWFSWFCLLFFLLEIEMLMRKHPSLFLSGFFAGLTLFFKQTFGLVAILLVFVASFILPGSGVPRLKPWRLNKKLLKGLSGIIIGILPYLIYISASNSFLDMFQNVFISTLPYIKKSLVYTPYPLFELKNTGIIAFLAKKYLYLFPLIVLSTSIFLKRKSQTLLGIVPLFAFLYFLIGIYPTADILHFTLVLPVVFPFAASILAYAKKSNSRIFFYLVFLCYFMIYLIGIHKLYFRNYYAFESNYSKQIYPVFLRKDQLFTDQKHVRILTDAIFKIQNLTLPSEKILVFPYAPLIYFAARRDVSGPYVIAGNGLLSTKSQNRLIEALEKDCVKVVIMQIEKFDERKKAEDLGFEKEKTLFNYLISRYSFYDQVENLQIRTR